MDSLRAVLKIERVESPEIEDDLEYDEQYAFNPAKAMLEQKTPAQGLQNSGSQGQLPL